MAVIPATQEVEVRRIEVLKPQYHKPVKQNKSLLVL
jgi:hypothetical protein